jgi:hypothetical protein
MAQRRKCEKSDIILTADIERPEPTDLSPLPLKHETCEYILNTLGGFQCDEFSQPQLIVKKKNRQLKVEGSVKGKVVITVQTGEETPRVFTFIDDANFTLTVDLLPGDKILFQYGAGRDSTIKLKALIVKKHHC